MMKSSVYQEQTSEPIASNWEKGLTYVSTKIHTPVSKSIPDRSVTQIGLYINRKCCDLSAVIPIRVQRGGRLFLCKTS